MLSSRAIVVFLSFLSGTGASLSASIEVQDDVLGVQNLDVMSHFRAWMDHHGKQYDSNEETHKRMNIWMENHGKNLSFAINQLRLLKFNRDVSSKLLFVAA